MSCDGVRRCRAQEIELLDELWRQIKPIMDTAANGLYSDGISWCNIYQNQKFKFDFPLKQKWLEWALKLTQQIYPNNHILVVSLIRNPPHSTKLQEFHHDYEVANSIMIPLVDQSVETATQFIQLSLKQPRTHDPQGLHNHFGKDPLKIIQKEGLDFMKVVQIVCKSHTILRFDKETPHRGIPNVSDKERVMFTIHCSPVLYPVGDEPIVNSSFKEKKQ